MSSVDFLERPPFSSMHLDYRLDIALFYGTGVPGVPYSMLSIYSIFKLPWYCYSMVQVYQVYSEQYLPTSLILLLYGTGVHCTVQYLQTSLILLFYGTGVSGVHCTVSSNFLDIASLRYRSIKCALYTVQYLQTSLILLILRYRCIKCTL